jgi:UDP-N-acetylglucosamine 2-epimerase (non-hydrolysing)
MIDSLINNKKKIDKSPVLKKLSLQEKKYIVLTLHRQENVDDKAIFGQILSAIKEISDSYKIVWPMHPRTKNKIKEFNFDKFLEKIDIIEPLGYIDMIALIKNAKAVLTDSGGIQEETTFLKIPCLTLRNSTERPITEQIGTNKVIGINKKDIFREVKILSNKNFIVKGKIPKFWDGKASERIVKKIVTISKK